MVKLLLAAVPVAVPALVVVLLLLYHAVDSEATIELLSKMRKTNGKERVKMMQNNNDKIRGTSHQKTMVSTKPSSTVQQLRNYYYYHHREYRNLQSEAGNGTAAPSLVDGVPSEPFSLSQDEFITFGMIPTLDGSVTCETRGMNGNADLLMYFDEWPDEDDTSLYTGSTTDDSNDSAILPILGETLFVIVIAMEEFTDVTVTCTSSTEEYVPRWGFPLPPGYLVRPMELFTGSIVPFEITPINTTNDITCYATGPNGDADLFAASDLAAMDERNYDVVSIEDASEEMITWTPDGSDTLYVGLLADSEFTNLDFGCFENRGRIEEGVSIPLENAEEGEIQVFPFTPSGQGDFVACTVDGPNGDADLYMQYDAIPHLDTQVSDGYGHCFGSVDTASVRKQPGSDLYVMVYAFKEYTNVILECFSSDVPQQTDILVGATSSELDEGKTSVAFGLESCKSTGFEITPTRSGNMTCQLSGPNGDGDMFLFWDTTLRDLRINETVGAGQELGSNETVITPVAGETLFVLVVGNIKSDEMTLICESDGDLIPDPTAAPATEATSGVESLSITRFGSYIALVVATAVLWMV